mmetsp:Transcript_27116/g.65922  ORF Transcript_27116/g.65922 Transcript_27116/m.65922 type:complete len:1287 (+) Transcript_27116:136-3996(+)
MLGHNPAEPRDTKRISLLNSSAETTKVQNPGEDTILQSALSPRSKGKHEFLFAEEEHLGCLLKGPKNIASMWNFIQSAKTDIDCKMMFPNWLREIKNSWKKLGLIKAHNSTPTGSSKAEKKKSIENPKSCFSSSPTLTSEDTGKYFRAESMDSKTALSMGTTASKKQGNHTVKPVLKDGSGKIFSAEKHCHVKILARITTSHRHFEDAKKEFNAGNCKAAHQLFTVALETLLARANRSMSDTANRITELGPTDDLKLVAGSWTLLYCRSLANLKLKSYDAAVEDATEAIRLFILLYNRDGVVKPHSDQVEYLSHVYWVLGCSLLETGSHTEAYAALRKSVDIRKGLPLFHPLQNSAAQESSSRKRKSVEVCVEETSESGTKARKQINRRNNRGNLTPTRPTKQEEIKNVRECKFRSTVSRNEKQDERRLYGKHPLKGISNYRSKKTSKAATNNIASKFNTSMKNTSIKAQQDGSSVPRASSNDKSNPTRKQASVLHRNAIVNRSTRGNILGVPSTANTMPEIDRKSAMPFNSNLSERLQHPTSYAAPSNSYTGTSSFSRQRGQKEMALQTKMDGVDRYYKPSRVLGYNWGTRQAISPLGFIPGYDTIHPSQRRAYMSLIEAERRALRQKSTPFTSFGNSWPSAFRKSSQRAVSQGTFTAQLRTRGQGQIPLRAREPMKSSMSPGNDAGVIVEIGPDRKKIWMPSSHIRTTQRNSSIHGLVQNDYEKIRGLNLIPGSSIHDSSGSRKHFKQRERTVAKKSFPPIAVDTKATTTSLHQWASDPLQLRPSSPGMARVGTVRPGTVRPGTAHLGTARQSLVQDTTSDFRLPSQQQKGWMADVREAGVTHQPRLNSDVSEAILMERNRLAENIVTAPGEELVKPNDNSVLSTDIGQWFANEQEPRVEIALRDQPRKKMEVQSPKCRTDIDNDTKTKQQTNDDIFYDKGMARPRRVHSDGGITGEKVLSSESISNGKGNFNTLIASESTLTRINEKNSISEQEIAKSGGSSGPVSNRNSLWDPSDKSAVVSNRCEETVIDALEEGPRPRSPLKESGDRSALDHGSNVLLAGQSDELRPISDLMLENSGSSMPFQLSTDFRGYSDMHATDLDMSMALKSGNSMMSPNADPAYFAESQDPSVTDVLQDIQRSSGRLELLKRAMDAFYGLQGAKEEPGERDFEDMKTKSMLPTSNPSDVRHEVESNEGGSLAPKPESSSIQARSGTEQAMFIKGSSMQSLYTCPAGHDIHREETRNNLFECMVCASKVRVAFACHQCNWVACTSCAYHSSTSSGE